MSLSGSFKTKHLVHVSISNPTSEGACIAYENNKEGAHITKMTYNPNPDLLAREPHLAITFKSALHLEKFRLLLSQQRADYEMSLCSEDEHKIHIVFYRADCKNYFFPLMHQVESFHPHVFGEFVRHCKLDLKCNIAALPSSTQSPMLFSKTLASTAEKVDDSALQAMKFNQ